MKRILPRLLVLLCLPLLAMGGSPLAPHAPQYAITLSADNAHPGLTPILMTATVTRDGIPLPAQHVAITWQIRGGGQAPQPGPIITTNAIGQATYTLNNGELIPRTIIVTAALASDPEITATTEVRFALPAGFIAIAPVAMTWDEARAYCRQRGGRLPLINNLASWDGENPPGISSVDGFGVTPESFWPSGLPRGIYWTGTTDAAGDPIFISGISGEVNIGSGLLVLCVQ